MKLNAAMEYFWKYFRIQSLFRSAQTDREYFSEMAKEYSRIGNKDALKQFLENYALTMTERDTAKHLQVPWTPAPTYQSFHEVKKLLSIIDLIEKSFDNQWKKL